MLDAGKTVVNTRMIVMWVAALILLLPLRTAAHDIPNDVTVHAFVRPDGQRLHLLVRVPLKAMRDVDYPRRGAGLLDLALADAALRNAATLWIADSVELYENDVRLGLPRVVDARVSLESDKSFASYEQALAHLAGPRLPSSMELYWEQGLLDVLFEYPIGADRSDFSIRPRLERLGLRTTVVIRFLPATGVVRAFDLHGDPGLVRLDPRWHQAAWRFVESGFFHILGGTDHLLFLLFLVIPFRKFGQLVVLVTSFTVAHSITLIASAYNLGPDALWFPPLIETLQFAGSHLLTSLLSFNLGVELGQLLVLVVLVPALEILFRFLVAERLGTIILSLLVGHTAWHWMTERAERLSKFPWPALDASQLAVAIRWLMGLLILAGLAWFARGALRERARQRQQSTPVLK